MAGLTRVRRFQQDDAHIFCRPDDVQQEIEDMLKFIDFVYGKFGLKYEMFLSTRCVCGLAPPSEPRCPSLALYLGALRFPSSASCLSPVLL